MADGTHIQWTDLTWNLLVGCSHVSPGCDRCYAAQLTGTRLKHVPLYTGLTTKADDGRHLFTGEVRVAEDRMLLPMRHRAPRRIFVNAMSDAFHPGVPTDVLARMFAVMALTPQHQYQLLTKRPQRMAMLLSEPAFLLEVWRHADELSAQRRLTFRVSGEWPLPNVWLGVSVESAAYAWRAQHLHRTPAAVRFVSAEPLLGPLPNLDLHGIDWLIVGGESQAGARLMHIAWARQLLAMCREAGTAFFMKQTGAAFARLTDLRDRNGGDASEWPADLRVREYPRAEVAPW